MFGRDPGIARLEGQRHMVLTRTLGRARGLIGQSLVPRTERSPQSSSWSKTIAAVCEIDHRCLAFARKAYPWFARGAIFVIFFWFGVIKLLDLSEATGLAQALTAKTIGASHFETMFNTLAVFECLIGVLALIPRAVRLVTVLLFIHLAVVCAPLVLVPELTWQEFLVPTMDGQYIIKNVLIVATAIGLFAHATPSRRHADWLRQTPAMPAEVGGRRLDDAKIVEDASAQAAMNSAWPNLTPQSDIAG